jgi:DNA-binding beta-propeller fold protein YncE
MIKIFIYASFMIFSFSCSSTINTTSIKSEIPPAFTKIDINPTVINTPEIIKTELEPKRYTYYGLQYEPSEWEIEYPSEQSRIFPILIHKNDANCSISINMGMGTEGWTTKQDQITLGQHQWDRLRVFNEEKQIMEIYYPDVESLEFPKGWGPGYAMSGFYDSCRTQIQALLSFLIIDPYKDFHRDIKAIEMWDNSVSESDKLVQPRGIAIAPDGSIFVANAGNNNILHFDSKGKLINTWGSFSGNDPSIAPEGTFNEPWGIAIDSSGFVYVSDTWNLRIQKFSADGSHLLSWGDSSGLDEKYQLYGPRALAIDIKGRVFVADTGNKRIIIYNAKGEYLDQIEKPDAGLGFDEPVGIAFGLENRLYVADAWNRRVVVLEEIKGKWHYQKEWPIAGWDRKSFTMKPYLSIDKRGYVLVTDPDNSRVLVFNSEGALLYSFGSSGNDVSSFSNPTGVAVDKYGRFFVSDTDNNRIMVFTGE